MVVSPVPLRRVCSLFLVIPLLVLPSVVNAAGLCLQDTGGRQYVLNKVSPKIAAAKAKPFGGVSVDGSFVRPLSGVATKSGDGGTLSLAFTLYRADVNSGGYSIAGASTFHQIVFDGADGSWDIGDAGTSCYWQGGVGAGAPDCISLTAIDCSTVVIP